MDRRTAIKWLMAATAAFPALDRMALGSKPGLPSPIGYGPDPDVTKTYKPGDFWPLTFTPAQLRTVSALCDLIIPADSESPSASQVGVPDFLDEWVSAPYTADAANASGDRISFADDRALILEGLAWLDGEAVKRFGKPFSHLDETQKTAICDDICWLETAKPQHRKPADFFARFRDLTAGGFYTTPEGMRDLKYVGNVPLASFDGPPLEALKKAGLA